MQASPLVLSGCSHTAHNKNRRKLPWNFGLAVMWYILLASAFVLNCTVWIGLVQQRQNLDKSGHGQQIKYIPVRQKLQVNMDMQKEWMVKAYLGGQISLQDLAEELAEDARVSVAPMKHGILQDPPYNIRHICLYGERCSGTTWVASLLRQNFRTEINEGLCPNKHGALLQDYDSSVPNEFLFLGPDTLVITVWRNAFDWASSFYKTPWGAANHCNVTFETFLTREWSAGALAGTKPYCPKYEDAANYKHTKISMFYEGSMGVSPADVMELRRWKLLRQLDFCAMRKQAVCAQYEGISGDWQGWLMHLRDTFGLRARPGFPAQVSTYKGLVSHEVYKPHSELAALQEGQHTQLFNATTIALLQQRLDLRLEAALGYQYRAIAADPMDFAIRRNAPVTWRAKLWASA